MVQNEFHAATTSVAHSQGEMEVPAKQRLVAYRQVCPYKEEIVELRRQGWYWLAIYEHLVRTYGLKIKRATFYKWIKPNPEFEPSEWGGDTRQLKGTEPDSPSPYRDTPMSNGPQTKQGSTKDTTSTTTQRTTVESAATESQEGAGADEPDFRRLVREARERIAARDIGAIAERALKLPTPPERGR